MKKISTPTFTFGKKRVFYTLYLGSDKEWLSIHRSYYICLTVDATWDEPRKEDGAVGYVKVIAGIANKKERAKVIEEYRQLLEEGCAK